MNAHVAPPAPTPDGHNLPARPLTPEVSLQPPPTGWLFCAPHQATHPGMKICSAHGCRQIITSGSRCSSHLIVRGAQHRALRKKVLAEEQTCWLCHKPATADDPLTLDHVVPVAHGGSHLRSNGRAAHASCNTRRGSKSPDDIRGLAAI